MTAARDGLPPGSTSRLPWSVVRGIGRSLVRLGRQLEQLATQSSDVRVLRCHIPPLEVTASAESVAIPTVAKPSLKGRGYAIGGAFRSAASANALYRDLLADLWHRYPEAREAMQRAMQRGSRGRAYAALQRERLYPGKPARWVSKHSRELPGGWWVGTNESQATLRRLMARAVRALEPAVQKDIIIRWDARS